MSASPTSATAMSSTKRPLEDPSSPSAPTDLPDAKRPALDKLVKEDTTVRDSASSETVPEEQAKTTEAQDLPAAVTNGAPEAQPEVDASAGTNGTSTATVPEIVTAPPANILTQNDPSSSHAPSLPSQDETNWIHIRAVISSAEAATCIGKGGENVTQIRKLSGAKCTVSDYSRGAVERILTVSGSQEAVSKVCSIPLGFKEADTDMGRPLV